MPPTFPAAPIIPQAWEIPPGTSHLYGWFIETGAGHLARTRLATGGKLPAGTNAIITVGFKAQAGGVAFNALASTYEYRFPIEADAQRWIAQLRAAAEPGKVIWAMRRAGIVGHQI